MNPETEIRLGSALKMFRDHWRGSQDVETFIASFRAIEDDWGRYLDHMGQKGYLPDRLIQRTHELTRTESLLSNQELIISGGRARITVDPFSLFSMLEIEAKQTGWTHVDLLAACRITQDELDEYQERLEEIRSHG